MFTFKVVHRESEIPGHQITADVVRNDGKVVRNGMWPGHAAIDCTLLNEYASTGMTTRHYHAERMKRMRES